MCFLFSSTSLCLHVNLFMCGWEFISSCCYVITFWWPLSYESNCMRGHPGISQAKWNDFVFLLALLNPLVAFSDEVTYLMKHVIFYVYTCAIYLYIILWVLTTSSLWLWVLNKHAGGGVEISNVQVNVMCWVGVWPLSSQREVRRSTCTQPRASSWGNYVLCHPLLIAELNVWVRVVANTFVYKSVCIINH
jgi:hypothetical protein